MKYKKKPVIIEAVQMKNDDYSILNVLEFIGVIDEIDFKNNFEVNSIDLYIDKIKENGLTIKTLEGDIHASIDDFIIKGIKGEFYPCKPDIFSETYQLVD